MNKRSFYVNNIVFIALCSAITVVCSQISVPIGPVPVTLQTFAIALSGYLLGAKGGTAAVTVYIITGLIGLPDFAGFKGGISVLFGPTGGFLIGFIVLAFFCGVGKKAKKTFLQLFSGAAGLLLCHALGTVIKARPGYLHYRPSPQDIECRKKAMALLDKYFEHLWN